METLKDSPIKVTFWTAAIIIISIVCFFVKINDRMKDIESNLKHLNGKTDLYAERYEETLRQQTELKIRLAEIDTKLIGIESLLSDIKKDLNVY